MLATALGVPLFAQQPDPGGIVTEPLIPPKRPERPRAEAEVDVEVKAKVGVARDSRFKPAPFRTLEIPQQAEPIEPIATAPRYGARMRLLDKMTGRTRTFEISAGTETMIDRLRVRLEACRSPDDNARHGTMAFMQIWDTKREGDPPVFSGWMFAESPALSALDHPRYDVWVISCTTSAGAASAASR